MKKLTVFLILILGSTTNQLIANEYGICTTVKCPYVTTKDGNTLSFTCNANNSCKVNYTNKNGQSANSIMYLTDADSLIWINEHLIKIQHEVSGMGTIDSVFVDFATMQISSPIPATLAVNPNIPVVFSFNKIPIVRPIFDSSKQIEIQANYSIKTPGAILIPDTHFDQKGNLVLVYYSGANFDEKTEVIPVDYNQLGISNS